MSKYLIINTFHNSITYILPYNGNHCFLVDCGDIEKVIECGWVVSGVLLTHAHFDHCYGLNQLIETFPMAKVFTNKAGKEALLNPRWNFSRYHDEVEDFVFKYPESSLIIEQNHILFTIENIKVESFCSHGHDPSCISYIIGNNLYTGDAYIPGVKTVTTFPRSNKEQAAKSLARLLELERMYGYTICAGHPSK